jgi:GntR family transcriptional regulator
MHTVIQMSAMLPSIRLEPSGVPIYVQIRDQMLQAIGAQQLKPGEQLPTMRQVAVALKVDLNTVRHAYEELEASGAIVILRARGTFVAEQPPLVDLQRESRRVASLAAQSIATARAAGIDPRALARQILELTDSQGE